jgi:hypothetical protein
MSYVEPNIKYGCQLNKRQGMDTVPVPFDPFLQQKIKPKSVLIIEKDFLAGVTTQDHMIDRP